MSNISSEEITISTGDGAVNSPALVERIASFVAAWGRKGEDNPDGCTHDPDTFCEFYGCTSFVELADAIRQKFLGDIR